MSPFYFQYVLALERLLTGAKAIEDAAEAEQITAMVDRIADGLLRRHVGRSAQYGARLGELYFFERGACETKIKNLYARAAGDK